MKEDGDSVWKKGLSRGLVKRLKIPLSANVYEFTFCQSSAACVFECFC